jgi:hypothetical protein
MRAAARVCTAPDPIMQPNNPFGEFHDEPAFAPLAERKNEA